MAYNGQTLIINGHNYTKWVKKGGFKWSRNDVDSKKSVRVIAGATMRRDKLGTKRKLSWTMLRMPEDMAAQLDSDLSADFYQATIRDMHGESSITAYTTSVSAELAEDTDDQRYWDNFTFDMIEQ